MALMPMFWGRAAILTVFSGLLSFVLKQGRKGNAILGGGVEISGTCLDERQKHWELAFPQSLRVFTALSATRPVTRSPQRANPQRADLPGALNNARYRP